MGCSLDFWYFARIFMIPLAVGLGIGLYCRFMLGPWLPRWSGVKYRVLNTNLTRYKVQQWVWFFPFWVTTSSYNSFSSKSDAHDWMEDWAENGKDKVEEVYRP